MNDAGRIGFVIKGAYDATATYDFLDLVYYKSASYVAKKLTVGNAPQESNEYWQIFAKSDTLTNISDATVDFTIAQTRVNIQSGEDSKTLFGKIKRWFADFKDVVFTGSYNSLSDRPESLKNPNALTFTGAVTGNYDGSAAKSVAIPSVGNGTLTIQKNGTDVQTFTANQSGNVTANITVPTNAAGVGAVATSKVLTTKEQINANTDTSNVAGATAVKAMVSEINGSLTSKDLYNSTNWVSGITNYAKTICRSGDVVFIYVDFYVPDSYSGTYTSYPIITGLPKPNYKHSFLGGISIDGLFTQPMFEIDVDGKLYLQVRGTAVNGRRIFATILYIL